MKITKCKKCNTEKDWNGDDINCPFQENDEFGENWNCGTINKIREICNKEDDYRIKTNYCEGQSYTTIETYKIDDYLGLCLFVTWYKIRGSTDAMYILSEDNPPIKPTQKKLIN